MGDLQKIKELIFAADNKACFIERERILSRLQVQMQEYQGEDKYALILAKLLEEVSTPVLDCDYFAGHAVEALPDEGMCAPSMLLWSVGHMSFDHEKLLRVGLDGILEEIEKNAAAKADAASLSFAKNARIVVEGIRGYSKRYAQAARDKGFVQMAEALDIVPCGPAYDFYSALQSLWIVHMIAGCYVGSRDYAFGRFDQYMLPFYEKALQEGNTEEELTELLAGFLVKTNEICGRTAHNFESKPVLCQSSKQYVNIGGANPNAFSKVVLNAAKISNMAQPQIIVLLKPDADSEFTDQVFEALSVLQDKMNIYNYDLILNAAIKRGIPEDIARDFTYSACCSYDLNYHSFRLELFTPVPQIFLQVLHQKAYGSLEELVSDFSDALTQQIQDYASKTEKGFSPEDSRRAFVLDSLLLSDSAKECHYACDGSARFNILNIFCPGVATVGDSLMVIDRLVFKEKRFDYQKLMEIVGSDFDGQEELRQEILNLTRFGNDSEQDTYAVMAGKAFLDAVDRVKTKPNFYIAPGFYSLERDNGWAADLAATPDGRKAGEPFSENQSPTYGADKNGITALLKSLSKLPFDRTMCGGLNLTFTQKVSAEVLQALVLSYFQMGGFHVGISVIDRNTLQDAMERPERYKSLTVRLYGFSEYFVSLPKWQQVAVLNRTAY